MKRLIVMRHGKTEQVRSDDHSRNLIKKGIDRSRKYAFLLKDHIQKIAIDIVISSSANRTKQTADILDEVFEIGELRFSDKMYMGSTDDYLEEVYSIDNSIDDVILVGHNPTVTNIAYHFDPMLQTYLRTSEICIVELETMAWEDLANARIIKVDYIKKP